MPSSTEMINARQRAIERQIARLERRCAPVQIFSNRVSWVRAGVLLAGIALAVLVVRQIDLIVGIVVLMIALALFIGVVVYHRRLEQWIDTLTLWRKFKLDQLACMRQDWDYLDHTVAPIRPGNSIALDLDLTGSHSLAQLIDTTLSREASRLLVDWLTQAQPKLEEVQQRQNIVRELLAFTRFRERLMRVFRLALRERVEGTALTQWLLLAPSPKRMTWTLIIGAGLVALNLGLYAANQLGGAPAWWAITLVIYLVFWLANQSWLAELFEASNRLDAELARLGAIFQFLEQADYRASPHLADLCAPFRDSQNSPAAHTRGIRRVTFGVGLRSNPVLGLLLNLILPWDFLLAFLIQRSKVQVAEQFPKWIHVSHELDAFCALANFAYLNPDYVFPIIAVDAQPILSIQNLGHPLIPRAQNIRNDFSFATTGELALITGSNMAGKSTFIKSIGINLCLAYAGAPVAATRWVSAPLRLQTCIRITDSVTDGFSYFYAEVQCLKHLLDELRAPDAAPLLYLIDEIFRGTNNRERLIGSRAYIQSLIGANGVGLIATHDLELAGLAESQPQIRNFHFRDQVADGKLVFDYKVQPGACPTTNALKIMELAGLPILPK